MHEILGEMKLKGFSDCFLKEGFYMLVYGTNAQF